MLESPLALRPNDDAAPHRDGPDDGPDTDLIEWLCTVPLWLDLPGLRVVHTCWSDFDVDTLRDRLGGNCLADPGPGGAFALIVRHHDGAPITLYDRALFVRNRRTNALHSAVLRADRASADLQELLGEPIVCNPVVVISGDELTVRSRPDTVHVLHDHLLTRWLSRLPRTFDDDQVQHIVRLAS